MRLFIADIRKIPEISGGLKNCFCHENVRNFLRLWRKVKIAAGIAKAMSRTNFGLTTSPVEIAAVRSKNEFLEVPFSFTSRHYLAHSKLKEKHTLLILNNHISMIYKCFSISNVVIICNS